MMRRTSVEPRTRRVLPENASARPVAIHCHRVEWGAVCMILLGVTFLIAGVALSAAMR